MQGKPRALLNDKRYRGVQVEGAFPCLLQLMDNIRNVVQSKAGSSIVYYPLWVGIVLFLYPACAAFQEENETRQKNRTKKKQPIYVM